jgi:hypothetical protein
LLTDVGVEVGVQVVDLDPVGREAHELGGGALLGVRDPDLGAGGAEGRDRLGRVGVVGGVAGGGVARDVAIEHDRHERVFAAHREHDGVFVGAFAQRRHRRGRRRQESVVGGGEEQGRELFVRHRVVVVGERGVVDAQLAQRRAQVGQADRVGDAAGTRVAVAGVVGVRRVQVDDPAGRREAAADPHHGGRRQVGTPGRIRRRVDGHGVVAAAGEGGEHG